MTSLLLYIILGIGFTFLLFWMIEKTESDDAVENFEINMIKDMINQNYAIAFTIICIFWFPILLMNIYNVFNHKDI